MFTVIFRAVIKELDEEYEKTVSAMRAIAFEKYGCLEFVSFTEGKNEMTISYWQSEKDIQHWKQDGEHLLAQELGRSKWYESYTVEVAEITRQYSHNNN